LKIEDIHNEWSKDSVIDRTELGDEELKVAKLIDKWVKIASKEKLLLRKYKQDYNELYATLWTFYVDGPSKEQVDAGWELPAKGKILRTDADMYISADKRMIDLSLKIGMQEQKLEDIGDYMKSLHNRHWTIKSAIDWIRFINGG
jgi:hypothetical protein